MLLNPSQIATKLESIGKCLLQGSFWSFIFCLTVGCNFKGFQSLVGSDESATNSGARAQQKATPTVDDLFAADPYVINTGKTKIRVGLLKTENMDVIFDSKTRSFSIQGEGSLTDAKTKNKLTFPFLLNGVVSIDGFADLKPQDKEKKSSQETPHFRAKVTCLTPKDGGRYDCGSALIDLIVRYQGALHTDQLETHVIDSESPLAVTEPVKGAPSERKKKKDQHSSGGQAQFDDVNTPDGRYVGRIWEDLAPLFDEPLENDSDDDSNPDHLTSGKTGNQASRNEKPPKTTTSSVTMLLAMPASNESDIAGTKPCRDGVTYMKSGAPRPCNQAFYDSQTNEGRLVNGNSLLDRYNILKDKAMFRMTNLFRERYYGTFEMIELIDRMGKKFFSLTGGKPFLQSGDISQLGGGPMKNSEHASPSHQMGTDIDLRFPVKAPRKNADDLSVIDDKGKLRDDFMLDKTWFLLKYMVNESNIKIRWVFVAQPIKDALCTYADRIGDFKGEQKQATIETLRRLFPEPDHHDHFHVRIQCTSDHPRCRDPRNGPYTTHNCRNL